jgi:hypothetical protein
MDSAGRYLQHPGMKSWSERRALALEHVEKGHRAVKRQREIVEQRNALGMDTTSSSSEALLKQFERSQEIFEKDLAELDRIGRKELRSPPGPPRGRPGQRSSA